MGPKFGEPPISLKLLELGRSNLTRSHEQELGPLAESFSLGWLGGRCPQLQFCKLPELPQTSRARKHIFGLQVSIDKANSRRYHVTRY